MVTGEITIILLLKQLFLRISALVLLSLYRQFSARAPLPGTPEFTELHHHIGHLHNPGLGRSASMQGGYQIATLFVTLAVAISGGLVTGNHCLLSLI
jgi:hypothetical protein